MVVTEFFDGASEIGDVEQVDDHMIDDGLRIIRRLWTPAWPTATSSRPTCWSATVIHLIDVFFAEVRPAPGGRRSTWPT